MYQIISFFTYNTDRKPFPFDAWPSGRDTTLPAQPREL